MSRDHLEATQEPTLRRLQRAREEGRVARSNDLSSVLFLLVVLGVGFIWFPSFISVTKNMLSVQLSHSGTDVSEVFLGTGWEMLGVILIPCAIFTLAAVCAGILQVGGIFAPSAVSINPSRMDVPSGWSRLFGARARMHLLFSTSKLVLASLAALMVLLHHGEDLIHLGMQETLTVVLTQAGTIGLQAVLAALSVLLILGIFDYVWQRYAWKVDLRMTRQEIIEEHREREGTSRQARQHAAWIAKKHTACVIPSLVVVGSDVAISIRWNATSMSAPIVLDMVWGNDCKPVLDKAKEEGIPIAEDHTLALQIANTSDTFLGVPSTLHGKIAGLLMIHRREGT